MVNMTTSEKTVLITGCSQNSIGNALAREFLRRGFHVIATARSLEKLKDLEAMGVDTTVLDITSSESIQRLRSRITHLDILFNNAGCVTVGTFTDISMEAIKAQFETNCFGPVELTKVLLPLLIESKGIVVNHTSQSPYGIPSLSGSYAASKMALAQFTDMFRLELSPFDVKVVELVTGAVSSNMTNDMKPQPLPPDSLYTPIKAEMTKAMTGEDLKGYMMDGDVYAKKVVADLLDGWRTPVWIWRGGLATTMWWVWIIKCMWKGVFDGLIARTYGQHLLRARLKGQADKKSQ